MKHVRGGSGLGDSLYVRVIAEHLLRLGHPVTAYTFHPDVFIGVDCRVEPFGKLGINVLAHYVGGKNNPATSQWDDVCDSAQVARIPLRFTWHIINQKLVDQVREQARGRPVVLIHGGRAPMNRTDNFGIELLPEKRAFDQVQEAIYRDVLFVRIGEGKQKYAMDRAEMDLWGKTSVADLLDLAWDCDALIGPCSFVVPLAEAFDKPLLAVWAAGGMHPARHPYLKSITPQKVLAKASSSFVIDDWGPERVAAKAKDFLAVFLPGAQQNLTAGPSDVRFIQFDEVRQFFKGKSVAVVGSAPSIMHNVPGFIDSHDIVVRINNPKCGAAQGMRTDVFYSFFGTSIKKSAAELKREGVKLMMCKCPDAKPIESDWHERNGKTAGIDFRWIYELRRHWWFCPTYIPDVASFMEKFILLDRHIPTTGFAAILDVLACEPASCYVTGFDFFASGIHNGDQPWRKGDPADPIGHRPELEAAWLAGNYRRYPLKLDARLSEIVRAREALAA
jgi:hypothetical protein